MTEHKVVPHDEWLEARTELLAAEKEFTRARDELTRRRLDLPWEAVDKEYTFKGPDGEATFADLFDGRSQLLVYHFMFDPEDDVGCPICSFWADNFEPVVLHLRARDVTFVAVSLAPFAKITAYKERMGWSFPWFSSFGSDFNFDYGVSFRSEQRDEPLYNYGTLPSRDTQREGVSVFARDGDGRIPHLLRVRPRHRPREHRVQLPRPRPERTRRGRPRPVLGPPARRVLEPADDDEPVEGPVAGRAARDDRAAPVPVTRSRKARVELDVGDAAERDAVERDLRSPHADP
jgi:predicted dithiol-disulfide oxidoreductase (DUF899 family)